MYTRIAKGLLTVFNVLGVIAALIIAVSVGEGTGNFSSGFFAFIVALIGMGLLLMFFGIFVELANNIMDIRICLQDNSGLRNNSGLHNNGFSNGKNGGESILGHSGNANTASETTWLCHRCKTVNPEGENVCGSCGHSKQQQKRPSLEALAEEMRKIQ